jgi:hypothetical protein
MRIPMIFKTMPVEVILKALEGQEDVLTPEVQRHQKYFKSLSCPRCHHSVLPIVDPKHLFKENAMLPTFLAECTSCKCQFEPYTKIEVAIPKLAPEPLESAPGEVELFTRGPG